MNEIESESHPIKEEYIVYMCENCKQYTYAKTNQNEKKCPRCHHTVSIKTSINAVKTLMHGTIVRGVAAANLQVRVLQNASHSQPMGFESTVKTIQVQAHKAPNSYESQGSKSQSISDDKFSNEYLHFIQKLKEWQTTNSIHPTVGFPIYMLDMILHDMNVPNKAAAYLKYKLNKHFGFRVINKDYCYLT